MGYGTVNTGYPSRNGGYVEMDEQRIPESERRENMLYGLVLVDFEPEEVNEIGSN